MKTEYETREWYLYVRATGEFDLKDAQGGILPGLSECANSGLDKVLVDLRELRGENPRIGRYLYLDFLGKVHDAYRGLGNRTVSIAFVGSSSFVSNDGYEEKVAEPYAYNIKTTEDIDEALEWLKRQ